MPLLIKVAARKSPLSQAQVKEVFQEVQVYHDIVFEPVLLDTRGDLDLVTSLSLLGKTDFFTHTLDECLKAGSADIAVHSAKDLPEELDDALHVIALTQGIDPRDSLVSCHYTLETLPLNAKIGVSSIRRAESVKTLRADLIPTDIRGSVDQRIEKLKNGEYDALILAEAGLLRLRLDIPRQILDIPVAPLQGQLAIVALKTRHDLSEVFKSLDVRVCG